MSRETFRRRGECGESAQAGVEVRVGGEEAVAVLVWRGERASAEGCQGALVPWLGFWCLWCRV